MYIGILYNSLKMEGYKLFKLNLKEDYLYNKYIYIILHGK